MKTKEEKLKNAAYAKARQIVRSKLHEQLDESVDLDVVLQRKENLVTEVAQQLINKVQASSTSRLNNLFLEYFGDSAPGNSGSTGERSDNPIISGGRKVAIKNDKGNTAGNAKGGSAKRGSPIVQYGKFGEDLEVDSPEFKGLIKKADKSDIDLEIIGEVYNRGLDAWTEECKVSPSQYAFARVNSYINQGKTYFNEDADLHELSKSTIKSYLDKSKDGGKDYPTPLSFRRSMEAQGIAKAKLGKTYKRRPLPDVKIKATNEEVELDEKRGLWDNIHAKQKRIKAGSGERMRKPGSKGAPSEADLKTAQESVDESKNTPYVKAYFEKGQTKQNSWKAMNKHGHVKHFGLPFKKAAEKHAGLSEDIELDEHIVKVKDGYRLVSKSTGKNLGTYPTKEGAEKREKQVQYFKHQNEEVEELDEVLQNTFKKREKFGGKELGQHISSIPGAKHIGTMENGHDVYHSYDPGDKMHDYHVVDPKTKRVNIHLTTKQQKAPGAEEVSVLTANTKSLGAHHLYKHLVTKHNKIISSNDQSPGARRVWDKVGEHKDIHIHGYDPISKKSFHMKPSDDEEYVDRDNKETNAIKADRKETKPNTKERKAHDDELEDLDKKKYTYIVMHKKKGLKEDCSCNQPVGTARNTGVSRKKIQSVERDLTPETPSNDAANPKNPASDMYKQQQIQKKIIDSVEIDPAARLIGTDSLVKTYKKATPGQNLDEAFNIAFAAGIGQTYTAADLGVKIQGGFALHPSVVEEDVVSAEKAPVIVPTHIDAYGNVIPAKTVMRKLGRKIIKSGNVHNGDTDQPIGGNPTEY